MTVSTTRLQQRIATVRQQLDHATDRAGRDPASITITAVSKTVDRQTMADAYDLGLRHFGENRVQDARAKLVEPMPPDATLHLIGQLQTNKANHAVQLFQIIESVDRPSLILELEKQAANREIELAVLLQVNIAGENQKAGCAIDEAGDLVRQIVESGHLRIDGLMTMAPLVADAEDVRFVFRGLRDLRDRLAQDLSAALSVLSMGMTNDFPVAIEEGATHIRIGRAIFG